MTLDTQETEATARAHTASLFVRRALLGGAVLGGLTVAAINTGLYYTGITGPVIALWPLLLLPPVQIVAEYWNRRTP